MNARRAPNVGAGSVAGAAGSSLNEFALGTAAREFGRRIGRLLLPNGESFDRAALEGAATLALVRAEQGHAYLDFAAPVLLTRARAAATADGPLADASETVEFNGHRAWGKALASGMLRAQPHPGDLLVLEGERLYLRRFWEDERALASALMNRAGLCSAPPPWTEAIVGAAFPQGSPPEQLAAVRSALGRGLAVITGGPGTGKTFVVARLLLAQGAAFAAANGRAATVALLAPTGKAARRVDESVLAAAESLRGVTCGADVPAGAFDASMRAVTALRGRASTVHSALETDPRGAGLFKHTAQRPLDADIVVLDEASMIPLHLMRALCDAVRPSAQLVLLGDGGQLQSVEAGSVLADIDPEGGAAGGARGAMSGCLVRLVVSRRFPRESGLGRLAQAVRTGELNTDGMPLALHLLDHDSEVRSQVRLVEPAAGRTTADAANLAAEHFAPLTETGRSPRERLALAARFALLCGHRRGPGGADEVNAALVRRFAAESGRSRGLAPAQRGWSTDERDAPLFDGMPVIVLRNHKDLGLYNGDVGVVCADERGALHAHFEGGRQVRAELLPEHAPAYALTVHKSQGSEYAALALVLPEHESPVLTRELVYTALTRWKPHGEALERSERNSAPMNLPAGVTIIARRAVLEAALRARVQRASGLRDRLRA